MLCCCAASSNWGGEAAARDGNDRGGEEADSRLHVPLPEADALCPEYRGEHHAGRGSGSCRREVQAWQEVASRPNAGATAICGKVEAELAEMSDEEAAEFLSRLRLGRERLRRLIRKSYELLGLVSFFTVAKTSAAPGPSPSTHARRRPQGPSIPIWKNTSSAPRPSTGIRCSRPARKLPRDRRARCGWKARTTW